MRAVAGEPALEVGLQALGQLGGERLGRRRPSSAAGRRRPGRPSSPSPSACSAKRGRSSSTAAARSAISAIAVAGELGVPGGQRAAAGAAGADRGDEGVALGERRRVRAARGGARGPQRGDDLVEVRAAQRRRAGHELEPVGQEDGDERPARDVGEPLDRRAVHAQPLRLARLEADAQLVPLAGVLAAELQPRQRRAEAHALALVRGPARAARAGEVDRLQQVRLAGAVAAGDHRQARARAARPPPRRCGSRGR